MAVSSFLGSAAKIRAQAKWHKYLGRVRDEFQFVPVGIETFGTASVELEELLAHLARSAVVSRGADPRKFVAVLRRKLSVALQRGNAVMALAHARQVAYQQPWSMSGVSNVRSVPVGGQPMCGVARGSPVGGPGRIL